MVKRNTLMHEILAVDADREKAARAILAEATITFEKKQNLFSGQTRQVTYFDDDRAGENEQVIQSLNTTVDDKLNHIAGIVTKHWDTALSKEAGNQRAIADLIINGEIVASGLPATFLLGLETRLALLRKTYAEIPTLDPSLEWEHASDIGNNVFQAIAPVSFRQEKQPRHNIMVPATPEHPAQVREWAEDVKVAKVGTIKTSGMITSARKSVLLGRIDTLIGAVKQARQRANLAEIEDAKIGKLLFDFINVGTV